MKEYYKIMDEKNGVLHTLFHGIDGSKAVPLNQWLKAEKKMSIDGSGGTEYLTGWHIIPSYDECVEYLNNFKNRENKVIAVCSARGDLRQKEHSRSNVLLADEIMILEVINGQKEV